MTRETHLNCSTPTILNWFQHFAFFHILLLLLFVLLWREKFAKICSENVHLDAKRAKNELVTNEPHNKTGVWRKFVSRETDKAFGNYFIDFLLCAHFLRLGFYKLILHAPVLYRRFFFCTQMTVNKKRKWMELFKFMSMAMTTSLFKLFGTFSIDKMKFHSYCGLQLFGNCIVRSEFCKDLGMVQ